MQIEVHPKFKGSGKRLKKKARSRYLKRFSILAGLLLTIAVFYNTFDFSVEDPIEVQDQNATVDDEVFVQLDSAVDDEIFSAPDVFVDIRGAPMILNLDDTVSNSQTQIFTREKIDAKRAPLGTQLTYLNLSLFEEAQGVQLTLPSTSADLAAFQARRSYKLETSEVLSQSAFAGEVESGNEVVFEDGEGSWGDVVGDAQDVDDTSVNYVETVIKNTTTQRLSLAAKSRSSLFVDDIVEIAEAKEIISILQELKFSGEEIQRINNALERLAPQEGVALDRLRNLQPGYILVVRKKENRPKAELLQMSFYSPDGYLLTLVQPAPGRFSLGADPWFSSDIVGKANNASISRTAVKTRLKDAIYTALLGNGLSSDIVGELLIMISRNYDLDQFTEDNDKIRLIMSNDVGLPNAARALFIGLERADKPFKCYVVQVDDEDGSFDCFHRALENASRGATGGSFVSDYLIPVSGTKTSDFGPRFHPILKRQVKHKGVDWAAPTGTPVISAGSGKVSRANVSPSYGNIIYVDHSEGYQTRYAHLHRFAEGIKLGSVVEAGQLIGYVGTTGRSTGPHLHFELRKGGTAIDPFKLPSDRGSRAVEALVSQIIKIESAGNSKAKNPRSSATGLGQFISSTWLRMMRTYRPDLVKKLSRDELLALRFDPDLSRAMVTKLAQENEAVLRSSNLQVTPGRLYLAHFLGSAGAVKALKANPDSQVLTVFGAGVVNANPFLRGWSIQKMADWSDRKMKSKRSPRTKPVELKKPATRFANIPPHIERYQKSIDNLLASL